MSRRLHCFGQASDGQLGVRLAVAPQSPAMIMKPVMVIGAPRGDQGCSVVEVACGYEHTLMRTEEGEVWSCGGNEFGQLGRSGGSGSGSIYPIVFNGARIIQVACGSKHSLAVADDGRLFAWGSNSHGQLGTRLPNKQLVAHQPKRVILPEVIQVACGATHSIALTENGRVHTWGLNGNGQLGTGLRPQSSEHFVDTPSSVESLVGVPIIQVAAGGRHSVVLSVSGAVFSWGENLYGQLGCGDNTDRHHPGHVKSLRSMKVVYVTCGDGHTAALTKEGRLFTFGADTYGQLGHGSQSHSIVPKPVLELMGSTVTRVACGRCHTVVAVNRRMYAFGLGSDGQLGLGSTRNAVTPRPVPDTSDVISVFAGGDRTFFLQAPGVISEESGPHCRLLLPRALNLQRVRLLLNARDNETLLIEELEAVFSSASCVNASFLKHDDTRFNATKSNHGIDLDEAMETFNLIASSSYADQHSEVMQKSVELSLLGELGPSPPDVEALRLYIILPCCHAFTPPAENYKVLHVPFAAALLSLTAIPKKIIEHWWTSFAPRHFNRVVRVFKSVLEYILSLPDVLQTSSNAVEEQKARDTAVLTSLKVLDKLNSINVANHKIPIETFYLDELADKRDIAHDFVYWLLQNEDGKFYWSDYPFVFNAVAKTTLLQTDAKVHMQLSINEANRQNIAALFVPFASPVSPYLVLQVDRARIIFDTLSQLLNTRPESLRKPLKIVFAGEEADDAGGVKKEFFMLLFQELLDPNYGMFVEDGESHEIWFSGSPFEHAGNFQLIGILCGLAIYNGVLVDFHFPLALYKKLLGQRVTLDDLKQLSPTEGRSLEQLLDYEGDDFEDVFGLTFTTTVSVFDQTRVIDLRSNGSNVAVTQENKHEYVELYVSFRLDLGPDGIIKQQFDAFAGGFHRVMTSRILRIFQPKELMEMVIGNENYDWEEFKKVAEYRGAYWAGHESIKLFWEVFFELTLEERKKFLLFLTGSNRIPLYGMKAVKMIIQPAVPEAMPVAHTCFNLLDLPQITGDNKELMRRKLLTAIEYTQGFSLV
uniref:HECT domain-containing protein n=1 Tax=Plectus sambesii TaxID=2011161 RepID=A0A914VPX8_9BILA